MTRKTRPVELVTGNLDDPSGESLDWVDDEVHIDSAARRHRALSQEIRPHGDERGRRCWIKTLEVRADEAGNEALEYLLKTLRETRGVDESRRRRAEPAHAASMYLVYATKAGADADTPFWIDEETHLDIAAALRRRDQLRLDIQPHEPAAVGQYVIKQLTIRASEASDVALEHLIDGLESVGEDRRRRSGLDDAPGNAWRKPEERAAADGPGAKKERP